MSTRGVHLQYLFESRGQMRAEIENPLFDLLAAVREHGSISKAARASGQSYRHVEALRRELQRVFATADDDAREVLEIAASHDLGLPLLQALVEQEHGLHLGLRFTGPECTS